MLTKEEIDAMGKYEHKASEKGRLIAHIREQDAALAEAREVCERYVPMEKNGGSHARWLAAHHALLASVKEQ